MIRVVADCRDFRKDDRGAIALLGKPAVTPLRGMRSPDFFRRWFFLTDDCTHERFVCLSPL